MRLMYPVPCNGKRRAQRRSPFRLPPPVPSRGVQLMRGFAGRIAWTAMIAAVALLALAAVALAHVERTAYWPNPKPDNSVKPAAGGKVPKARSLASTLGAKPPGRTR